MSSGMIVLPASGASGTASTATGSSSSCGGKGDEGVVVCDDDAAFVGSMLVSILI